MCAIFWKKKPQMIWRPLLCKQIDASHGEPFTRPYIVLTPFTGHQDVPLTWTVRASRHVTLGTTLPEAVSQTHHAFSHRFYSADHRDNYALCGTNHRLIPCTSHCLHFKALKLNEFFMLNIKPNLCNFSLYHEITCLNALKA